MEVESNNNNKLTDEQIDYINKEMDEDKIPEIANFPSNNGQETTNPEDREPGYQKVVGISIDPNTGEHKIVDNDGSKYTSKKSFEDAIKDPIRNPNDNDDNDDFKLDTLTEKELVDYLAKSKDPNSISMLEEITKETNLTQEGVKQLLSVVNRKIEGEDFNIYKAFPPEIQKMVDVYLGNNQVPLDNTGKSIRNAVCEQLISEFIINITTDKSMVDFNKELENIFESTGSEIADSIVGYTKERNQKYREYAINEMKDDPEKQRELLNILDTIDEAYNLTQMKEFAKKCKVKKFEFEKPKRVFDGFLNKYKDSQYNIYDINMAIPILRRALNDEGEFPGRHFSDRDIYAFFICFCKHTLNFTPENVTQHAYMYYLIYNVVLIDINKGKSKEVSHEFLNNVIEVIDNLRARNSDFIYSN